MLLNRTHAPIPAAGRLVALASVALLLAGCSGTAASSPPAAASAHAPTIVNTTLSEFKIDLSAPSAPAGPVSFNLNNGGTTLHEFVVFKTNLALDKLPLSADGSIVDEAALGAGTTLVSEIEDIEVGAEPNLEVDLPAGRYLVICNIPAHYTSGMRAEFTTN